MRYICIKWYTCMSSQVHLFCQCLLSPFHDNLLYKSGNIPSAPAYGVIIFLLIHYLTTCGSYLYTDFLYFAKFLTKKHSKQGKLCCLKIAITSKVIRSPSLTSLCIHVWGVHLHIEERFIPYVIIVFFFRIIPDIT